MSRLHPFAGIGAVLRCKGGKQNESTPLWSQHDHGITASTKATAAKRVHLVSLKMVKEASVLYPQRIVRSPQDVYELVKPLLADADREHFVVVCLDTKNRPTSINGDTTPSPEDIAVTKRLMQAGEILDIVSFHSL